MTILNQYGWEYFQSTTNIEIDPSFLLGRVVSIKGFKYHLITVKGELESELSGKLMYSLSDDQLPKVGDWVSYLDYDESGLIMEVLPRFNDVSRKRPGNKVEKQVLAANVDFAIIVQGLDRDYNLRRLERYLIQMRGSNIQPIIILNKADLVIDKQKILEEIKQLEVNCEVIFSSTINQEGIEFIKTTLLQPARTYIMIGSSGVGKSSLLNAFSGNVIQQTATVSTSNEKGKHTTTTRDLFLLANGSLMIDTPGMREFGLTSSDMDSDELFPAIQKFAERCKFNDCLHINEHGCAVVQAVADGNLDADIYESYLKLKKEMRRFEINVEDKKRMNKQFGKMTREAKNHRNKYKF
jgi:ribosome biogenesis GTPase / thiamine phosphate phosphatase